MTPSRPYHVLVVCTGNTCRSPMAEGILKALFEEKGIAGEVRSAGTYALSGGPAQPYAIETAAAASLDITDHVARQLDEELVRWADTVLCMTRSHARSVREIDSTAEVRLVADWAPEGVAHGGEIRDPMGWDEEVYRAVFDELRACLEGFAADHAARPWGASPSTEA